MRGGVTDKSHDALGGRRSQTRRAERICANLGASRLARSAATRCDGPLDLVTNTPRQNDPDLSTDALERIPIRWNRIGALATCLAAFSTTNRYPLRRKMLVFLFGRIFCDEPVSTSSENALTRVSRLRKSLI